MEGIPIDSPRLTESALFGSLRAKSQYESGSLVGERFGVSSLLYNESHVKFG